MCSLFSRMDNHFILLLLTGVILSTIAQVSAETDKQVHPDASESIHHAQGNASTYLEIPVLSHSFHAKTLEQWVYSILSSIIIGLSGILPLLLIPTEASGYLQTKDGHRHLNRWLSFAVGSLVGDIFMHLLPEAWSQSRGSGVGDQMSVGLWVIVGILMFLVIEKVFIENEDLYQKSHTTTGDSMGKAGTNGVAKTSNRQQQLEGTDVRPRTKVPALRVDNSSVNGKHGSVHSTSPSVNANALRQQREIKVEGYLNLIANVVDNFTHGLAVGGSYLISHRIGLLTTFCILIHEVPHEVSDFVILLRAGFHRWQAAKAQLATASGCVLGAIFALSADSATTGRSKSWILPFTSGGFLYIALVSLAPTLIKEDCPRESAVQFVLMMLGLLVMILLSVHCDTL